MDDEGEVISLSMFRRAKDAGLALEDIIKTAEGIIKDLSTINLLVLSPEDLKTAIQNFGSAKSMLAIYSDEVSEAIAQRGDILEADETLAIVKRIMPDAFTVKMK